MLHGEAPTSAGYPLAPISFAQASRSLTVIIGSTPIFPTTRRLPSRTWPSKPEIMRFNSSTTHHAPARGRSPGFLNLASWFDSSRRHDSVDGSDPTLRTSVAEFDSRRSHLRVRLTAGAVVRLSSVPFGFDSRRTLDVVVVQLHGGKEVKWSPTGPENRVPRKGPGSIPIPSAIGGVAWKVLAPVANRMCRKTGFDSHRLR